MTLRSYLTIMIITNLVAWSIFSFILNLVDPAFTNWIGFLLFYVSLFIAISGTAAIIGFLVRFVALKKDLIFYSVKTAFRQSFLFAFLIVASLFLSAQDLLTWINLLLLIIILTIFEFFLISYGTKRKRTVRYENN